MKPPTVDEIQAYIDETNVNLDAKVLWCHYDMKGWALKTGPMKRWHSAVGLWAAQGWGKTAMSTRRHTQRNARPDDEQRARDDYQDYFEGKTLEALQDLINDPGVLFPVVWLMKEVQNAKKPNDS